LRLTAAEKAFFAKTCPYIDPTYFDFLEGYRYDASEVHIEQQDGVLQVRIEGYWYRTILWEVPIMALICQLYYTVTEQQRVSDDEVAQIVRRKMDKYDKLDITIADFGTRRRHSYAVHDLVIQALKSQPSGTFIGTS